MLVVVLLAIAFLRTRAQSGDLVCSRTLPDGETERRLHRGRTSVLETTVQVTEGEKQVQLLRLIQMTDSRHFIQLIYDADDVLRDCEYLKSQSAVDNFLRSFRSSNHNCSSDGESFKRKNADLTDYAVLRRSCKDLHQRLRQSLSNRVKRDLFLYPGTNWCGSGSNARQFTSLGYNAAADRCCRDHDHCPHTIQSFTRDFNFFNFRFHTISHCDCDERFRACLKLSGTAAGNMVGKLFFNIVQTKCFLFKQVKKCTRRSWWGKCLHFEQDKTAFLREALKY